MSIKLLSASALALAVSLASIPAFAAVTITEQRSVTVRYSDLDLSTSEGARALLVRIMRAARVACQPARPGEDLRGLAASETCMNDAIDRAVADVGSPLLAAARSGNVPADIAQK